MGHRMINSPEPRIAIVTALPIEAAAIRLLLTDDAGAPDHPRYHTGAMRSTDPDHPHVVVLAPPAASGHDLVTRFPTVEIIISVGVTGGLPAPATPDRHVRLGDIVIATGVVDSPPERPRHPIAGRSGALVRADDQLRTDAARGLRPWEHWLGRGSWSVPAAYRRPPEETDVLRSGDRVIDHPDDSAHGRIPGLPRVHRGMLGRGDPRYRFAGDVVALDPPGSGPPNAPAQAGQAWFGIRGVAHYGGSSNDELWRPYGSLAAAAYTRALLSRCGPLGDARPAAAPGRPPGLDGLGEVVEALLDILRAVEDTGRRSLLAELPPDVRTSVPDHPTPRVHVLAIVRTCARYPQGDDMLRRAAQAIVPRSPELARLEAALAAHWPAPPS